MTAQPEKVDQDLLAFTVDEPVPLYLVARAEGLPVDRLDRLVQYPVATSLRNLANEVTSQLGAGARSADVYRVTACTEQFFQVSEILWAAEPARRPVLPPHAAPIQPITQNI